MEEKPGLRVRVAWNKGRHDYNKVSNILVGAPTSKQHDYVIDRYIENVKNFTYPNFTLMLIDNSDDSEYFMQLKEKIDKSGLHAILQKVKPKENALETLAECRNSMIVTMLVEGFDYFLMLDTDTLPPPNVIERLMAHDKDIVGLLSHGGTEENHNVRPIVLKSGSLVKAGKRGLDYYSWDEIDQMRGKLTKVWATSVGCLLVKRNVLEAGVRFKYTPQFHVGEDIWFFLHANAAGFEFWLDPYRVIHENRYWQKIETTLRAVKKLQNAKVSKAEFNDRLKRIELITAELIRQLKEKKVIDYNGYTIRKDSNYPPVTIIIPTRNRWARLEKCIDQLKGCDYPDFRIVVVFDDDEESLMKFPGRFGTDIKLVYSAERLYYVKAMKAGLKAADTEFVVTLSDDMEIVDPKFLRVAMDFFFANFSDIGVVKLNDQCTLDTAAMALTTKKTLEKLDAFNDEYIHYWSDRELKERAEKANVFAYCPDVLLDHKHWLKGEPKDANYFDTESYFEIDHKTYIRRNGNG